MKRNRLAFVLACAGLLFVAVASAPAAIPLEPALPGAPAAVAAAGAMEDGPAPGEPGLDGVTPNQPDACPPLPPGPGDQFTPVACRRAPECSTDDDCTPLCGPTGGHCVHSSCPTRICKCR